MKCRVLTFLCLGGMLAGAPVLRANTSDAPTSEPAPESSEVSSEQPYSAIWTRNVFDLKPPEDPSKLNKQPEVQPPSNVKLVGIYTIFGKRALLSVQDQAKQGKPAGKEEYYNMSEGERHGSLELLEINPTARTVKIKNDEIVATLMFETNKSSGPGPGPMAGAPHPPGVNGFTPPPPAPLNFQNGALPSRSIRSSSPNLLQQPRTSTGASSGYQPMGNGVPNLFSAPTTPPPAAPVNNMSAEEAMTQFYLQQAAHQGDPNFPPPVPLPPGLGGNNNNQSSLPTPPSPYSNPNLPAALRNRTIPSFGGAPPSPP